MDSGRWKKLITNVYMCVCWSSLRYSYNHDPRPNLKLLVKVLHPT